MAVSITASVLRENSDISDLVRNMEIKKPCLQFGKTQGIRCNNNLFNIWHGYVFVHDLFVKKTRLADLPLTLV